jgi:hypothetical protein
MIAPGGHDVFAKLFSLSDSWPEKFVDTDAENFCQKETVFVRDHASAQLDVRKNVSRDVALKNLKFCHERVLRPPLGVTQFGNLPPDKI